MRKNSSYRSGGLGHCVLQVYVQKKPGLAVQKLKKTSLSPVHQAFFNNVSKNLLFLSVLALKYVMFFFDETAKKNETARESGQ